MILDYIYLYTIQPSTKRMLVDTVSKNCNKKADRMVTTQMATFPNNLFEPDWSQEFELKTSVLHWNIPFPLKFISWTWKPNNKHMRCTYIKLFIKNNSNIFSDTLANLMKQETCLLFKIRKSIWPNRTWISKFKHENKSTFIQKCNKCMNWMVMRIIPLSRFVKENKCLQLKLTLASLWTQVQCWQGFISFLCLGHTQPLLGTLYVILCCWHSHIQIPDIWGVLWNDALTWSGISLFSLHCSSSYAGQISTEDSVIRTPYHPFQYFPSVPPWQNRIYLTPGP